MEYFEAVNKGEQSRDTLHAAACSTEDSRCEVSAMLGDKSSCKEASHAVAEKKIRLVRVVMFHHFCKSIHILDSVFPAMFWGEVAKLGAVVHAIAMTEVVVSAYCEA